MKKLIISICLILSTNLVFCQDSDNYYEKVIINTDRSVYTTGESILFSAITLSNQELLSQILYIELIMPNGKQIKGIKCNIERSKSLGLIKIPENIYSGNYFIRAYTKYMRNFGPSSYDYRFIKIINPYHEKVLNESNPEDSSKFKLVPFNTHKNIDIEINKDTFDLREKIDVIIKNYTSDSFLNLTVSVVPVTTTNFNRIHTTANNRSSEFFYPETRGISLSGLLKDKTTNEPLVRKKVNLTIIQNKKNIFFSTFSDNNGNFYFALPDFTGDRDIFLSPEKIPDANPQLLINNDFCTNKISLPNPTFVLTKKEQKSVYKLAINNKVFDLFFKDTMNNSSSANSEKMDTLPFYGLPTNTLKIKDYIDLPTLKDYFTEITFPIKIKEEKENKQFKVIGTNTELNLYDPLIMVDLVPVYNVDHILEISPERINRIEVVTSPYVRGDITYGGIVNIISEKNDLAGVTLPKSGMFLNYLFLEDPNTKNQNFNTPKSDLIPDTRNTLYWNPDVKFDSNTKAKISFKTGDTDETYIIKVIGTPEKGEKVYSSKTFKVNPY